MMNSTIKNSSDPRLVRKNPYIESMMGKLYEQRHETGDIKFIIGREEIYAHRCVLAALSPKYKAQFYGAMPEKDVIDIKDVSPVAFKEFLQFFYTTQVTLTLDNIEDVLMLAQQSLVEDLVDECSQFLMKMVGMDKLLWCYRLSFDYGIKSLEEFCVKQISANIKTVFQTNEFLSCDREMLCHIMDLDPLDCNEIQAFDACILWAQAKCKQDGIDETSTTNLRAALANALYKIRFCSMTSGQFATIGRQHSGLISAQESIEVFHVIASKQKGYHLRAGGEISNTFGENNSEKRGRILMSLKCSVGSKSCIKTTEMRYVYRTRVEFSCDRTISLNGFVICNEIIVDEIYAKRDLVSDYTMCNSTSDNQIRITFHNPIQIEVNEKPCSITVYWEAPSSTDWKRFKMKESVEQDGISFKFVYNHNEINLITHLLYKIIE